MEVYHTGLAVLRTSLLLGSVVSLVGVARGALGTLRERSGRPVVRHVAAYTELALEFFVGATILNLILTPTWLVIQTAAVTIAVRKLISLSLGRLARAAQHDNRGSRPDSRDARAPMIATAPGPRIRVLRAAGGVSEIRTATGTTENHVFRTTVSGLQTALLQSTGPRSSVSACPQMRLL